MTAPKTIKIDEVEYVRADAAPKIDGDVKIVVLDRGFVYVGTVKVEGGFVVIQNAVNLRVWGTTKGLGELVSGPTSKTVTDKVGTVRAPLRALIHMIEVEAGKWNAR